MKVERSRIEFPLWRKKVDASLLKTSETPIPNWLHSVWSISLLDISKHLQVDILFNKKRFSGKLRWIKNGPNSKQLRFSFESELGDLLKEEFLMSYMRSLEGDIRKSKNMPSDLEKEVPFWEFLVLIRGYASLLKNSESIDSINISDYVLKNKAIDKN